MIAHEYGHHVQHLLGTDERVGDDRAGRDLRLGPPGAPGRLLRRRLGRPRRRDRLHRGPHRRRHRRRARCRGRGRRRPHPAAGHRPVDPEAGPTAPPHHARMVQHRLPRRRPQPLRHLRRRRPVDTRTGRWTTRPDRSRVPPGRGVEVVVSARRARRQMLTRGDMQLEAARGARVGAGEYVGTGGQLTGHRGLLSEDGVRLPSPHRRHNGVNTRRHDHTIRRQGATLPFAAIG